MAGTSLWEEQWIFKRTTLAFWKPLPQYWPMFLWKGWIAGSDPALLINSPKQTQAGLCMDQTFPKSLARIPSPAASSAKIGVHDTQLEQQLEKSKKLGSRTAPRDRSTRREQITMASLLALKNVCFDSKFGNKDNEINLDTLRRAMKALGNSLTHPGQKWTLKPLKGTGWSSSQTVRHYASIWLWREWQLSQT